MQDAEVEQLIDEIDKDKNGMIEFNEYIEVCCCCFSMALISNLFKPILFAHLYLHHHPTVGGSTEDKAGEP